MNKIRKRKKPPRNLKKHRNVEKATSPTPPAPQFFELRDTAPRWFEVCGEGLLLQGQTLRVPVKFFCCSSDGLLAGSLIVTADGEVLERAFVNRAFEGKLVRFQTSGVEFRTRVHTLDKTTGQIQLDAMPFFRTIASELAARRMPPFLRKV